MNQVELNPYLQQWELIEFCKKNGIAVTAYFPLGGAKAVNSTTEVPLMKDPRIERIAAAHGKTGVQVLVRWAIQRGTVCIPKSNSPERIQSNGDVFDFELTEEEMNEIKQMDKGKRNCVGTAFLPSTVCWKELWDHENVNWFVCSINKWLNKLMSFTDCFNDK